MLMQQQKQCVVCEWLKLVTSIRCPLHSEILVGSGMRNKRFGYNHDVEIGRMSLFPFISLSLPLTGFVLVVLFRVAWAACILQQHLSSRPHLNRCTRKLLVGITPSRRCQGAWWAPRGKQRWGVLPQQGPPQSKLVSCYGTLLQGFLFL